MATNSITGPNVPTTLTFALNGTLYPGDTFAEPTVLVSPAAAGTLVMNASQTSASGTPPSASPIPAGYTGTFTTKGVFTAAAGFTGEVTLSAEVMGVDDQDLDFTVTGPIQPETATFDPTSFVVS